MFRIVTGIAVLLVGLWFVYLGLKIEWVFFIHGGILSAIGLAILLNKKEDEIEEITNNKHDK